MKIEDVSNQLISPEKHSFTEGAENCSGVHANAVTLFDGLGRCGLEARRCHGARIGVASDGSLCKRHAAKASPGLTGRSDQKFPANVGRKFDVEGEGFPFSGNTFSLHVPQAQTAHAALREASLPCRRRVARRVQLPSAVQLSHGRCLRGVCDAEQGTGDTDRWPHLHWHGDCTLAQINQTFQTAMASWSLPASNNVRPTASIRGFPWRLASVAVGEASLRRNRAECCGMCPRHLPERTSPPMLSISPAYSGCAGDLAEANAMMDSRGSGLVTVFSCSARNHRLALWEFCTFENMHAFSPQFLSQPGAPKQHPVAPKCLGASSLQAETRTKPAPFWVWESGADEHVGCGAGDRSLA